MLEIIIHLQSLWEFSSAGSEHLPYKQRVTGSNPVTPTTKGHPYPVAFFILRIIKKNY